jgi:spore germination protein
MKALIRLIFVLFLGLVTVNLSAAEQRVWGYVAWWLPDAWKTLPLQQFERLVYFQIEVARNGALDERHGWPEQWDALRQATRAQRVGLDLGISLLDPAVFDAVFASDTATGRLLVAALDLAALPGVSGLHLDVEVTPNLKIQADAVRRYKSFVVSLGQRLRQMNPPRQLSVFLPFGAMADIYDARTLKAVDRAVLQGYDAHYVNSEQAGPISPLKGQDFLTWEKMNAQADRLGLNRAQSVMSFPLYGYEWTVPSCTPRGRTVARGETGPGTVPDNLATALDRQVTVKVGTPLAKEKPTSGDSDAAWFANPEKGQVTTLLPIDASVLPTVRINISDRVARYGARVEPESESLYYSFVDSTGVCKVGWFEDSYSLSRKSDWLAQQGLGGIAFFPLGYDQGVLASAQLRRWAR